MGKAGTRETLGTRLQSFTQISVKVLFLRNDFEGGGHSLIWPKRERAAGQGMVFGLSALNRVYNFMRTRCPRQGLNKVMCIFLKRVLK